jgi:hypothetical protein
VGRRCRDVALGYSGSSDMEVAMGDGGEQLGDRRLQRRAGDEDPAGSR